MCLEKGTIKKATNPPEEELWVWKCFDKGYWGHLRPVYYKHSVLGKRGEWMEAEVFCTEGYLSGWHFFFEEEGALRMQRGSGCDLVMQVKVKGVFVLGEQFNAKAGVARWLYIPEEEE